ncbi:MAG: DUF4126 domain-containing protein [Propionivibrio sp.]|nr:DUF4126 domain-containing protein [Propionivibrio sp.]MBP7525870.1 DUF4126 domain-containing protein [Propionivibrio sp.]MBP8163033.1 DUF4126 domain-containing protein [Propionivibrio sp.]
MVQSLSLAGGLAWASGIRLYAVLFSAGLLGNLGYLALPATLQPLENPWVIGIAGALFAVEFLADKIPIVDSIWDGIQTFIRIPAGAVLAALAMGEHPPELMLVAGLLGGSIAAGTHLAKAGGRALINTSPEPFSNVAASLGEEAMVAGGLYAAIYHPVVFLIILGGFVILLIWLLPKLIRGIRMLFGRLFRPSRST